MSSPTLAFGVLPSDRRWKLLRAKFQVMADALAERAHRARSPLRVLDAGIGRAKLERVYRHHFPDLPVAWHGLDLLPFRLEATRDVPGIRRVQGDLEGGLPFRDGAFDAVACSYVLQHLRDPARAVRELARVLRPGGLLLVAVPSGPQPIKLLREIIHPAIVGIRRHLFSKRYSYEPQIQFFNLPRVRHLLDQAGCTALRWQGLGFVTGGPLKPLENREWYYRWNLRLGRIFPRLAADLVCVAERRGGPGG